MTRKKTRLDKMLTARKRKLKETFREITNAVCNYSNTAPLAFINGSDGGASSWIFPHKDYDPKGLNKFDYFIEKWMGALYPDTLQYQAAIKAEEAGDDEYMELCYASLNFAFLLGHLVGCRSMGATREQLLDKTSGFTFRDIEWRRERFEDDRKSERARRKEAKTPPEPPTARHRLWKRFPDMDDKDAAALLRALERRKDRSKSTRLDRPELALVK